MKPVVDTALGLAASGLAVFPCLPSKAPACPHGHKDASRDPDTVRRLWQMHPGSLIGVPTGAINKIGVLDIDRKHPEAVAWLRANRHRLPKTRVHRTRSGGVHLIFKHDDAVRCTAGKIMRGVDTRGSGGFIIWWPATGLPVLCGAAPAPGPAWLLSEIQPKPEPPSSNPTGYAGGLGRFEALIRLVATAPEGERNHVTFWAACRAGEMVGAGVIAADMARAVLAEAATRAGLSRREAEKTAASGVKKTSNR